MSKTQMKLHDIWSKNKTEVSIRTPEHGPSSSLVDLLEMMMDHVLVFELKLQFYFCSTYHVILFVFYSF